MYTGPYTRWQFAIVSSVFKIQYQTLAYLENNCDINHMPYESIGPIFTDNEKLLLYNAMSEKKVKNINWLFSKAF